MFKTNSVFFWLFITPVWIFPIFYYLNVYVPDHSFQSAAALAIPFGFLYHIFIRIPHFVAPFAILYKKNLLHAFKQSPTKYIFIPALLFSGLFVMINSESEIAYTGVRIILVLGLWHIAMQGYGICLLLANKGVAIDKNVRRILYSFYFLHFLAMFFAHFHPKLKLADWLQHGLKVTAVLVGINLILQFKYFKEHRTALLYNVIYTLFAVPLIFIDKVSAYFVFYDGLHCVNYLGLAYKISFVKVPIRKAVIAYFFSCAISSLIIYFFSKHQPMQFMVINGIESFFVLMFGMHYYYESFIWKDANLKLKDGFKQQTHDGAPALAV